MCASMPGAPNETDLNTSGTPLLVGDGSSLSDNCISNLDRVPSNPIGQVGQISDPVILFWVSKRETGRCA